MEETRNVCGVFCLEKEDGDLKAKGLGCSPGGVPQEAGKEELIGTGSHDV